MAPPASPSVSDRKLPQLKLDFVVLSARLGLRRAKHIIERKKIEMRKSSSDPSTGGVEDHVSASLCWKELI